MFGIHGWELALVLLIFLVLFGKRIPGIARSLGQTMLEFKKGFGDGQSANSSGESDDPNGTRARNPGDRSRS